MIECFHERENRERIRQSHRQSIEADATSSSQMAACQRECIFDGANAIISGLSKSIIEKELMVAHDSVANARWTRLVQYVKYQTGSTVTLRGKSSPGLPGDRDRRYRNTKHAHSDSDRP